MKIRIKGNSVRFRLTKTEVANFGKNGLIEETTAFPNGNIFGYCLQRKKGIEEPEAEYVHNRITVFVPEAIADEWTQTDQVGFQYKSEIGNGKAISLLVEKDFVCLDHTFEDQSDNYPNPNKNC